MSDTVLTQFPIALSAVRVELRWYVFRLNAGVWHRFRTTLIGRLSAHEVEDARFRFRNHTGVFTPQLRAVGPSAAMVGTSSLVHYL